MTATTIEIAGIELLLLPEKALFLPESRTLLVADVHIGKALSFRRLGVPVPSGTTSETLAVLSELVCRWDARCIVFLGDFLHSRHVQDSATMLALDEWRTLHATLEMTLVRGNHDDRAGDPPPQLGIRVVDEPLLEDGFALCHHPKPVAGQYVLAGHLHPCVHVGLRGWDHLRLPCFWFADSVGVLPAFGAFTGMHPVRCGAEDRIFAVADSTVAAMPVAGERFAA